MLFGIDNTKYIWYSVKVSLKTLKPTAQKAIGLAPDQSSKIIISMNKSFLKSMGFDDAILIDARYGAMPVAIAADIMGKPPKAKRPAKRWTWEDCKALAKVLNVTLSRRVVLFANGSFEHGKQYSFRNPSQCYEALLSLQRDRLARLSDDDAIAAGQSAKECF